MKRTRSHQPYRSDLEWEARTAVICFANPISNLKQSPGLFKPINHCAEMLTQVSNSTPKSKSVFIFFQKVYHF